MKKHDEVDLNTLRPVSLAEIAARPNERFNTQAVAPDLFEQWWAKHRHNMHWSVKQAARAAWHACASSLGVYEDQNAGESK